MKDNQETTAARVIGFLSSELALPREEIGMLTRLRQDLGLNGPDAANLIEAFTLLFDVDPGRFRANDYFMPEEGAAPRFAGFLWLFGNGRPLKTLTVKDLIMAVERGRLV